MMNRLSLVRPVRLALVVVAAAVITPPVPHPGTGDTGQHEDHRHVAVAAAAMIPAAVKLPRTGWVATASSEETGGENGQATNVLDGNPATIWHSLWGTTTALPQWVTIDMRTTQQVSGLVYTPRPTGKNGRIGRYEIRLSIDGATWSDPVVTGTSADDATIKTMSFAAGSARYVRLVSLAEAGGRGSWASAAEIDLLGDPGTPTPATPLPRTGWTVAASDAETPFNAANVLDGNPATLWHSRYATPLPHSLTIDMKRSTTVGGLVYRPRASGVNGRIGEYRITVSADGTAFGTSVAAGVWPDNAAAQTVRFPATQARYVRLTALTEAGGRGPWSSAAEIDILAPMAANVVGAWGPMVGFPIVPAASALLPNNKLLIWSAYSTDNFGGSHGYTQTAIMDLVTGQVTQRRIDNTGHDMFCPGTSMLADGRILVTGGSDAKKASIYNPFTNVWTSAPDMTVARGYQGQTTLSTGEVFTVGGSWSGGKGGKSAEVYSPANNRWRPLSGVRAEPFQTADPRGVYRADNHAWLFAAAGGRVFHAGPSATMHWVDTAGQGTVTDAGRRGDSADAMNGNAVMYDIGKILTVGGATAYQDVDATNRAYTVDITRTAPTVTRVGDMASGRAFANSVALPDGSVVVIGGESHAVPFSDQTAVLEPELWNPATGRFTRLAPMATPRTYHSVANLLPDGTVFSGGGGLCGTCATNHPDGQILVPPYLLNPDGTRKPRPAITSAPTVAAHGATITIGTDRAVSGFALVRTSSVTHSVDNDQRRIPLVPVSTSPTSYRATVPVDPGIAPPGNYLLFALDKAGTPSVSAPIRIGGGQ